VQAVQRSCGCPLPGSVQGQAEWCLEHPGLEEGSPCPWQGAWNKMVYKAPSNCKNSTILGFYDSVKKRALTQTTGGLQIGQIYMHLPYNLPFTKML